MRLDRIEIEGFKSIAAMDLKLAPLNVLIGANGAGKSNFFGALRLLGELVEGRLQRTVARSGGASTLLHHGPRRTSELRIEVHSGVNRYRARLGFAPQDQLFFEEEMAWGRLRDGDRVYSVPMKGGHQETRLHDETRDHPGGICSWMLARVRGWRLYHFHALGDLWEKNVLGGRPLRP